MRTAFLTEMNFKGKVVPTFPNMRTEFAWMAALKSDHYYIYDYENIKNYDAVFIIFPKAITKLNAVGVELTYNGQDKDIGIYKKPVVETLKNNNTQVCVVQEGPSWFFNEYDLPTQFNFYNQLAEANLIFAHNKYDIDFYKGLFPHVRVESIPSLMYPLVNNENLNKEDKCIIGGNFCHWYGGFQSYIVASEFDCSIYVPSMHCKRNGEEQIPGLNHLTYMNWIEWMKQLKSYKYAVHLMPTIAAGTFSLNCAYFGIPCIGNIKVDTQNYFFPDLSIDVGDVNKARNLAIKLKQDVDFYNHTSNYAKNLANKSEYTDSNEWLKKIESVIQTNSSLEVNTSGDDIREITAVFTSCGRFDLLNKTFQSFLNYNTYPIKKYVVVDNSTLPIARTEIEKIFSDVDVTIIINEENIGQVSSIDKAYSEVNTDYIFHCEDDWEFFDYGFIEKSIDVLEHDSNLININVRVRFDGERGSMHPVTEKFKTKNGTVYHEYVPNYLGAWHGFAWNPGLRKRSDYDLIKPYKKYKEESGVGRQYFEMGKRSACLEKYYCKHIGQNSSTLKRNE